MHHFNQFKKFWYDLKKQEILMLDDWRISKVMQKYLYLQIKKKKV